MTRIRRDVLDRLALGIGLGGCNVDVSVAGDTGLPPAETSSSTSEGGSGSSSSSSTGTVDSSESGSPGPKLDVAADTEGEMPVEPPAPPFPTTCAEAQTSLTSVGCEFYPLALPQHSVQWGDTAFIVSNVSNATAHVVLEDRDGVVETLDLAVGSSEVLTVGAAHQLLIESAIVPHGFRLTSDEVLQVFMVVPPERAPTADAGIVLPASSLGKRHRVATWNGGGPAIDAPQQYVVVVATEDATMVTFELARPGTVTHGGDGVAALDQGAGDDEVTVALDALDVLVIAAANRLQGNEDNELTGSQVRSDKPVAVYAGTSPSYLPRPPVGSELCCADLLAEAVPPTAVFGRRYAAVKFFPLGDEPDLWRIMADVDGTEVMLAGGVDESIALDAGEHHDVLTPESFVAEGNVPFALVHYMTGSELVAGVPGDGSGGEPNVVQTADCGELPRPGDPAMSWVYPRGNWLDRYLFTVDVSNGQPWCHDRMTLVAEASAWDQITADGAPLPAGTPLGDGLLQYVYLPIETGTHEVVAPPGTGVELTVTGYASDGSYVFAGGVGLQLLNPAG